MSCEGCNKQKTITVTEINAGQKVVKKLCKDCPYAAGTENGGGAGAAGGGHQPINQLLTNFVMQTTNASQQSEATCEHTGLTWADFRNAGLLGHETNYDLFEQQLTPLLQRAHEGATHHTGKVPERRGKQGLPPKRQKQRDLSRLKRELAEAVEAEDYEKAAGIRDQIQAAQGRPTEED